MAPRYSAFQTLTHRIASTRLASRVYARTLHRMDRAAWKLSGRRMLLSAVLSGVPEVMVTTVGARSGLPHTLPLLRIRDESDPDTFAIVASNFGQDHHPGWYFNLKANPGATCSMDGRTGEYVAHEASGEEYERFWRQAMETYVGFAAYKERAGKRRFPIMVMSPVRQGSG